jgi:diaminopimelate epimerase
MNGAGNDFVLVDNRQGAFHPTREQIVRLCHRQRGVGADGLLLLNRGRPGVAPWAWEFYNCDGSVAEMCGNGARCFARFVQRRTGAGPTVTFLTGAGLITATLEGERVTVTLTPPRDLRLREAVTLAEETREVHSLDTGVPHAVLLVTEIDQVDVLRLGAEIRRHPHFAPRGTNVDFVQVLSPGSLRVRTFERGVEGETLACGTGVTAAALVCARLGGYASPVTVQVRGGERLEVAFREEDGAYVEVRLTGPADTVFEGEIDL